MRLIEVNVLKEWVENWFTKNRFYHPYAKNNNIPITELYDILEQMPSAQPEITLESAIDYLHSIGWMQEHDKILTESAQPEVIRCGECKHSFLHDNGEKISRICGLTRMCGTTPDDWFCADAERREE